MPKIVTSLIDTQISNAKPKDQPCTLVPGGFAVLK